ncbi:citramalate synthase [Solibaculum mannosilyticum]|uniref:Citramalate synthase n=1 Tax=Solibaculum mannosilyticum TaxID=2780922 RepID=A0A7I8D7U1_9FIRM|nr:citramalate synthase [Solibaculum mannosilyticum]BCI61283.1 citramalate synthase [Solibaculum mannosilyticum]
MNKSLEIFDSTLRDGSQGEGISFSVEDKLAVVRLLDELGIPYIEAGNPGSNPKDMELFREVERCKLKHATLVAFGSTRRKGIRAEEDKSLNSLLEAGTSVCCIFGKSWDLHVTEILGTTLEENLNMIRESVAYLKSKGKRVFFDAEHFFDGYRHNPQFAMDALAAAVEGGAETVVLCDTNGGCFPEEIKEVTRLVVERFPEVKVGIHCHNDSGVAVAGSMAAVEAGAVQVQGTYLGFGERCGNANLSTVIANAQIKMGVQCIPEENLSGLTQTARELAEVANLQLPNTTPYVGASAFAHKAGMHADGVLKNSCSFEHVSPDVVGNERRFLMSEQTGRTAVLRRIHKLCPGLDRDSLEIRCIIDRLKQMEMEGYQFEGADASFDLVVRKELHRYSPSFELVSYKILDEQPVDDTGNSATATIKIRVNGQLSISAAEGDGPVHALDQALREALAQFYPRLEKSRLIDYKVRVMDSGDATAAVVRVLITSTDGKRVWTTVGVSADVIRASWLALVDSFEYKLICDREAKD